MSTVYERTWQFDINRAPSDGSTNLLLSKSQLWYWKAFLVGDQGGAGIGLWTVLGSSDGATGALDATDRWGAVFDGSKIVRATAGVAHSWITLKSTDALGPYYLTIDWVGTADNKTDLVFSKVAPTGGSVTNRPTATDEWTYVDQQFNNGTSGSVFLHGLMTVTGDVLLLHSLTGSSLFSFVLLFQRLSDTKSVDNYRAFSHVDYDVAGIFSRAGLNNTAGLWKGRNFAGSAAVDPRVPHYTIGAATVVMDDMSIDATDAKYDDLPMYLYVPDASQKSLRGRLADLRWCPSSLTHGTVDPAVGSPEAMVVGEVWVPSDTSPTL
jgi:hypothetical protein